MNFKESKHELVENEIKTLQELNSRIFIGQSYFFNDGAQLYLIFQTVYYTLKRLGNTEKVISWRFKGWSSEQPTTPTTTDNSLSPSVNWYGDSNFCLSFKGSC